VSSSETPDKETTMNATPTAAEISAAERIANAMARDVLAEGMPFEWTGLDPQDADQIPDGCRLDVVESIARDKYNAVADATKFKPFTGRGR
jgi:hypothetical protein